MSAIQKLVETLRTSASDIEKGYAGTKAAGTRGRKALQEVRTLAQDARKELLAVAKGEMDKAEIDLGL